MSDAAYFSVKLSTPLGPIRGKVAIETGPMGLAELVPTALELTNILVDRALRREEQRGQKVTCGPGCGVCCCQMVALSPPEAFYLSDLIASLDDDVQEKILGRIQGIVRIVKERGMVEELMAPEYSDDTALAIAKEYFGLGMSCPFLEDDSCSIHPNRPVACREYNVTSPAAWCADPYSHEIEKVPMPMPLSIPLARLTAQMTDTTPRLIPLTLVPMWVSENTDLKDRAWPGQELFARFMAEVGKPSG